MFTVVIYQRKKSNWTFLIEKYEKANIYSSRYAALTACYSIPCKTHYVLFNNLLKIPVLAVFGENASETPRDKWHCEANAGLPACVAVLLWGERHERTSESGPPSFPGVSNGRHRKPYLSRSSIRLGSHLPGAGYMRAESYESQDKDHAGGFEHGFICRMLVFCTDG